MGRQCQCQSAAAAAAAAAAAGARGRPGTVTLHYCSAGHRVKHTGSSVFVGGERRRGEEEIGEEIEEERGAVTGPAAAVVGGGSSLGLCLSLKPPVRERGLPTEAPLSHAVSCCLQTHTHTSNCSHWT